MTIQQRLSDASAKISRYYRSLAIRERALFFLSLAYLLLYLGTILSFPEPILDSVIYSIAPALLTVEAVLIAFSPNIKNQPIRDLVSVGVGVPAVLVSVTTIARAYFESLQNKWLSWVPTTNLFIIDNMIFALLVELYAVGALVQRESATKD